jgi:hypothetical protein
MPASISLAAERHPAWPGKGGEAMSDVDEVLEKLVTDQAFRTKLRDDPAAALGGYDLEEEDLAVLAATLDEGQGSDHGVEQRTSKSAFLTAIMGLSGSGVGGGADPDLVAPDDAEPDSARRSQCQNNLKQLAVSFREDDPIQDLATDDGPAEVVHPTYPGVYVQETPSAEVGAAPPDASLRNVEDEQPLPEGWPAKWAGPASSEPPSAPDAEVASPQPRVVGETGPDDPTDAPEGMATGDDGARFPKVEIHLTASYTEADGVSPTDAEFASGDTDLEAPSDADEEPSDLVAVEEPEEAITPEAPQTDPTGLAAERETSEAETVHAFLKANGTDMQGEEAPPDPEGTLGDATGQQDVDR